jgi:hypothetical protein
MPEIAGVRVWTSTDGGAHWTPTARWAGASRVIPPGRSAGRRPPGRPAQRGALVVDEQPAVAVGHEHQHDEEPAAPLRAVAVPVAVVHVVQRGHGVRGDEPAQRREPLPPAGVGEELPVERHDLVPSPVDIPLGRTRVASSWSVAA